jgi:predicted RecB family endonuclease
MSKNRGGDQPTPQVYQPSVDDLASAVQEKLVFDQAVTKVQTDYPDIVSDRNLEMLAVMRSNEAIAQGVPRAKALLDAAEEIYKSVGKTPIGRSNTSDKPVRNSRLENKERLEPVRSASSTAVTPALSPEEDNPSSVIQEMAARRLGQSLPRQTG